jgi:hypothetical protein
VLDHSARYVLNSRVKSRWRPRGFTVIEPGLLSGYVAYQTRHGPIGSELRRLAQLMSGQSERDLQQAAAALGPGSQGVRCRGMAEFRGLALHHHVPHLYRAMVEWWALRLRAAVQALRDAGVPCRRFVAVGPLARQNPLLMRVVADMLCERVVIHPATAPVALGAAVLGVIAAGASVSGFASASMAMHAMARAAAHVPQRQPLLLRPDRQAAAIYDSLWRNGDWADELEMNGDTAETA